MVVRLAPPDVPPQPLLFHLGLLESLHAHFHTLDIPETPIIHLSLSCSKMFLELIHNLSLCSMCLPFLSLLSEVLWVDGSLSLNDLP